MSIAAAAIVPHSPLLIPAVSGQNLSRFASTVTGLKRLFGFFKEAEIETVLLISSHGTQLADAYTINQCSDYQADFSAFGDLTTKVDFSCDLGLCYRLKESVETSKPVTLACEIRVDYGIAVPAFYLKEQLPHASVVPLYHSQRPFDDHIELGRLIHHELQNTSKKIALLVSGDMSHTLTESSPGGWRRAGKEFDDKFIKLLKKGDRVGLSALPEELVNEAQQCLYRPFLIMLGALGDINFSTEIFSYEAPLGVGLLTARLKL